jgi:hypothetical protein
MRIEVISDLPFSLERHKDTSSWRDYPDAVSEGFGFSNQGRSYRIEASR